MQILKKAKIMLFYWGLEHPKILESKCDRREPLIDLDDSIGVHVCICLCVYDNMNIKVFC